MTTSLPRTKTGLRFGLATLAVTGGIAALVAAGLPAIAAAFFDATGKNARRLPLKAEYVQALLKA